MPKKESWWGEIGELADILPREKLIIAYCKALLIIQENGYVKWKDAWEKDACTWTSELRPFQIIKKNNELESLMELMRGKMLLQTNHGLKIY